MSSKLASKGALATKDTLVTNYTLATKRYFSIKGYLRKSGFFSYYYIDILRFNVFKPKILKPQEC